MTLRMLSLGFDRKQVLSWRTYSDKGDKCHTRRFIIQLYRKEGLMFGVFLPIHLFNREKCQKRGNPHRHLLSVDAKLKTTSDRCFENSWPKLESFIIRWNVRNECTKLEKNKAMNYERTPQQSINNCRKRFNNNARNSFIIFICHAIFEF